MKHSLLSLAFLLVSISGFAQNDSTKNLVRIWKMNPESVQISAKSRYEKMKTDNPAMAGQVTVEMIAGMMSQSTFDFKADGKYVTNSPRGEVVGTWKLSADKKSLITFIEMAGETTRKIQRISDKFLILKSDDGTLTSYSPAQ